MSESEIETMGTRGYIVVKVGGRYYAFYRQFDTYPRGWGQWVLLELKALITKYGGDIDAVCELIRAKFAQFTFTTDHEEDVEWWDARRNNDQMFLNILLEINPAEKRLYVEQILTGTQISLTRDICIEYVWTLDFDDKYFTLMSCYMREGEGDEVKWPMKHLYRLHDVSYWINAARECFTEEGQYEHATRLKEEIAATMIQQTWKKHCLLVQALEPETGILYQVAQRMFQRRVQG